VPGSLRIIVDLSAYGNAWNAELSQCVCVQGMARQGRKVDKPMVAKARKS
jgi:hypothetical protein